MFLSKIKMKKINMYAEVQSLHTVPMARELKYTQIGNEQDVQGGGGSTVEPWPNCIRGRNRGAGRKGQNLAVRGRDWQLINIRWRIRDGRGSDRNRGEDVESSTRRCIQRHAATVIGAVSWESFDS